MQIDAIGFKGKYHSPIVSHKGEIENQSWSNIKEVLLAMHKEGFNSLCEDLGEF
jgi:hypothetical protein